MGSECPLGCVRRGTGDLSVNWVPVWCPSSGHVSFQDPPLTNLRSLPTLPSIVASLTVSGAGRANGRPFPLIRRLSTRSSKGAAEGNKRLLPTWRGGLVRPAVSALRSDCWKSLPCPAAAPTWVSTGRLIPLATSRTLFFPLFFSHFFSWLVIVRRHRALPPRLKLASFVE